MTPALLIQGMRGLGDNLFQRPFVRAACERRANVYLETPWPELYADLPVRPVATATPLRTQALNEARQPAALWSTPPAAVELRRFSYGHGALRRGSIVQALERTVPLGRTPFAFDLPPLGPSPAIETGGKPLALVRPVTVRREWRNPARNPRPEYLAEIAGSLMATHHVVCVAHLAAGEEWLDGPLPPHHQALIAGELDVRQLLALVRAAAVAVGGVGWLVPAAIAAGTPAFIILGGQGGHNGPAKITDPRMNLTRLGYATPDRFCGCDQMGHRCDKRISNLPAQWAAFRQRVAV